MGHALMAPLDVYWKGLGGRKGVAGDRIGPPKESAGMAGEDLETVVTTGD